MIRNACASNNLPGKHFIALFYSEGIHFMYLDSATWSKHEGSRDYEEVNFKAAFPIWAKALTYTHSSVKENRDNVLKCFLFLGCFTVLFSFWVYSCNINYLYCLSHAQGKASFFFYLDAVRIGLKDKSCSAATQLKYRDHLMCTVRTWWRAQFVSCPRQLHGRALLHCRGVAQPSVLWKSEAMWQDFDFTHLTFTVQTLRFLKKGIMVLVCQSWHCI